jgi:hypothetical protein
MHEAAKLVRTEELMRLLLAKYRLRECAKIMDLSYATVRKWASNADFLNDLKDLSGVVWEDVNHELKTLTVNMQERMAEESEKALGRLIELMNDRTQKGIVNLKAAESILDRNPETSKSSKVSGSIDHRMKIDPMMLIHAAATAGEVDDYKRKQLAENNGEPR